MQQMHYASGRKFGESLDWSRADCSFAISSAAAQYARNVRGENQWKAAGEFVQGALSAEPYDDNWWPEDFQA